MSKKEKQKRKARLKRLRILDRAYDKCARLQAGQDVKLAPLEEEVLQEAIDRYYQEVYKPRMEERKRLMGLTPEKIKEFQEEAKRKLGL